MRKINETKTGFDMYLFNPNENLHEYMADNLAMLKARLILAVCPVFRWQLQKCIATQAIRGWA